MSERIQTPIVKLHRHCYVYQFNVPRRYESRIDTEHYSFLTNITGPHHPENIKQLHFALKVAYGHVPKFIKFKYDKYQ
jgi:hypothetical protein